MWGEGWNGIEDVELGLDWNRILGVRVNSEVGGGEKIEGDRYVCMSRCVCVVCNSEV